MDRHKIIVLLAYLKALAYGLLVGTALVVLHEVVPTIGSETVFGSPFSFALITAAFAVLHGATVLAICTPIWLALGRFRPRQQNHLSAAMLGFVATLLMSLHVYSGGTFDQDTLPRGLAYGLYGALAGIVC